MSFSSTVKGNSLDEGAVNKGIRIIKRLGDAAKEIGDLGDFHGWGPLIDINDEGESIDPETGFSGLQNMALALVKFNDAVSPNVQGEGGLNSDALDVALKALKTLVQCAGDVPDAGGKLQKWLGGFQGWDTVSDDLGTLGEAIVDFTNDAGGIDLKKFDTAMGAVGKLTELAKSLNDPFTGGILQDILGDDTLGGLASALVQLVPNLRSFIGLTRGTDPKEVDKAFRVLDKIVAVPAALDGYDSLWLIGDQIEQFANHFKTAYDVLASTTDDSDYISGLISNFIGMFTEDTMTSLFEIGTSMAQQVADGFSIDPSIPLNAVTLVVGTYEQYFIDSWSRFNTVGKDLASQVAGGFNSRDSSAKAEASVNDIGSKMVAKIRTYHGGNANGALTGMYGAGVYLVTGLIDGFNSKKEDAITAAGELAEAINAKFAAIENEHSPSRVWYTFGSYLVEGLANGISDNTPTAVNQARNLAEAMNGAFDDTVDLEAQATGITPVFQSSVDSINTGALARRAMAIDVSTRSSQMDDLVDMTTRIFGAIQNGSDLYLDDNILAGRINRRLGML